MGLQIRRQHQQHKSLFSSKKYSVEDIPSFNYNIGYSKNNSLSALNFLKSLGYNETRI